jgi:hypothetical protein
MQTARFARAVCIGGRVLALLVTRVAGAVDIESCRRMATRAGVPRLLRADLSCSMLAPAVMPTRCGRPVAACPIAAAPAPGAFGG